MQFIECNQELLDRICVIHFIHHSLEEIEELKKKSQKLLVGIHHGFLCEERAAAAAASRTEVVVELEVI